MKEYNVRDATYMQTRGSVGCGKMKETKRK